MTGDCCRPEESIHRCVRTHSHLYSYIYGLVALLDNIQSSFSKYHYFEQKAFLRARLGEPRLGEPRLGELRFGWSSVFQRKLWADGKL